MHISTIIKRFLAKRKEDKHLSFKAYYDSLIEAKKDISFEENPDKWEDLHTEDNFVGVTNKQFKEMFDILIDCCPDGSDDLRAFFERYEDKIHEKHLWDLYMKHLEIWYKKSKDGRGMALLGISRNIIGRKNEEIQKLKKTIKTLQSK